MFCPKCGKANDDQGKFCAGCGNALQGQAAPSAAPTPGTTSPTVAVAGPTAVPPRKVGVLLGIGIMFVPVVFSWFTLRKGHSTLARAVSLGWCGVFFIAMAAGDKNKNPSASSATASVAATAQEGFKVQIAPTAQAKPVEFVSESCDTLARMFGPGSSLSDLQKDELWKTYKGRAFKWGLKITEVSSDTFGGYTVQFKCGRNSPSLIQDIQIKYPDNAKDMVMQFEKGKTYEIKGVLNFQSPLLGMTADALQ